MKSSYLQLSKNILYIFLSTLLLTSFNGFSQAPADLKKTIEKAEQKLRGKSSIAELIITTVRPKYQREMQMKIWNQGDDYSLMYITSPARDRGTTYLKRIKEIWYYLPSIERNIKMPPSMMSQSWMGTDISNDDLVKKTSLANDFTPTFIETEKIDGLDCYHISLIPLENSEVIWGKIEIWIDVKNHITMKQTSFDEDMELVNTMQSFNVKEMGGEIIATEMEFFPADHPEQKTTMKYVSIKFDVKIPPQYFTTQYMTRIKA